MKYSADHGVWGAHRETAMGLAAQIFKFMTKSGFDPVLEESCGKQRELVEVLWRQKEFPSIRRFSIELLIAVMEMDRSTIEMRSKLEAPLEGVMKTTCGMESYSTFILCGVEQALQCLSIPRTGCHSIAL